MIEIEVALVVFENIVKKYAALPDQLKRTGRTR